MKVFYLQLILIKNPNFNVPLNIFLFNNWTKSNACRFLNYYAWKWYEVRRLKKLFKGSKCVQKFGASYKKRRQYYKSFLLLFNRHWHASQQLQDLNQGAANLKIYFKGLSQTQNFYAELQQREKTIFPDRIFYYSTYPLIDTIFWGCYDLLNKKP